MTTYLLISAFTYSLGARVVLRKNQLRFRLQEFQNEAQTIALDSKSHILIS